MLKFDVLLPLVTATLLLSAELVAAQGPVPKLSELVKEADLIVMGRVVSVVDGGEGEIGLPSGSTVHARRKLAILAVDRTLKGSLQVPSVECWFNLTDTFIGYRTVADGEYRIFALSEIGEHRYRFTSPYYPSFPAVQVPLSANDVSELIAEAQAAVLQSRDIAAGIKREAIYVIGQMGSRSGVVLAALRAALQDRDESVRIRAAGVLLAQGDAAGIRAAETALLRADARLEDDLQALRTAIAQDVDIGPATLPMLRRLLSGADAVTRQAVARALRRAPATAGAVLLRQALDDPDLEVQFNAVIAVAALAGERGRAPSADAFRSKHTEYVSYWREWLGSR